MGLFSRRQFGTSHTAHLYHRTRFDGHTVLSWIVVATIVGVVCTMLYGYYRILAAITPNERAEMMCISRGVPEYDPVTGQYLRCNVAATIRVR